MWYGFTIYMYRYPITTRSRIHISESEVIVKRLWTPKPKSPQKLFLVGRKLFPLPHGGKRFFVDNFLLRWVWTIKVVAIDLSRLCAFFEVFFMNFHEEFPTRRKKFEIFFLKCACGAPAPCRADVSLLWWTGQLLQARLNFKHSDHARSCVQYQFLSISNHNFEVQKIYWFFHSIRNTNNSNHIRIIVIDQRRDRIAFWFSTRDNHSNATNFANSERLCQTNCPVNERRRARHCTNKQGNQTTRDKALMCNLQYNVNGPKNPSLQVSHNLQWRVW